MATGWAYNQSMQVRGAEGRRGGEIQNKIGFIHYIVILQYNNSSNYLLSSPGLGQGLPAVDGKSGTRLQKYFAHTTYILHKYLKVV